MATKESIATDNEANKHSDIAGRLSTKEFSGEELGLPSKENIEDSLVDRKINGKIVKVKELQNSEEAEKFLKENKGYSAVDEDNGKIYVALTVS